jgi:DNA-binding CsgD family transcriptional regulator
MRGERFTSELSEPVGQRAASPIERLTPREREVLALVAEGLTAKEIGARLGISERTVSFHKDQMKQRLGVRSIIEMVNHFLNAGKPAL